MTHGENMSRGWRWAALALAASLCGCQPELDATDDPSIADPAIGPACTDPTRCCPPDQLRCVGDLDRGVVCTCADLWDCSENLDKCKAPLPTPDGSGGWQCSWADDAYLCSKPGSASDRPADGWGDWACRFDRELSAWQCVNSPPVPTGSGKLPSGAGAWHCEVKTEFDEIVCTREIPDAKPPTEPPPPPPSAQDHTCVVGQRLWCDPEDECGWGQVECDPATGTWEMTTVDGKPALACQGSLAEGRRPDTPCACYHYSFKADCCETPDCLVPPGTTGQICAPSPGKLCDYCDPVNPECTEPGGMCLMIKTSESFCVRGCADGGCPVGYKCIDVTNPSGTTKQCVPEDMSCFL